MQNLHDVPEAWQAKENGTFPGEDGVTPMTLRGSIGREGAALVARNDAKLALVMQQADPLVLPAWSFTLLIENLYRASAMRRGPKAVAGSRQSPATRGA